MLQLFLAEGNLKILVTKVTQGAVAFA